VVDKLVGVDVAKLLGRSWPSEPSETSVMVARLRAAMEASAQVRLLRRGRCVQRLLTTTSVVSLALKDCNRLLAATLS
jgi:hypothetical protein